MNAGCGDNSLSIAPSVLAATMPEIEVLARDAAGRAFLRGTSEARGDVVVLVDASKPTSLAPLAWALSRLAAGRDAVVLRGRYVVARRLAVLPVVVRASGPGVLFEAVFERRAQELGIDIVGSRPRSPVPLLLRDWCCVSWPRSYGPVWASARRGWTQVGVSFRRCANLPSGCQR